MINRIFSILKHIVFGFFRFLLYILRCGRRKKVPVDDSLPTDIVIGDSLRPSGGYKPYAQSSTLTNGYEVPSPQYHKQEGSQYSYLNQSSLAPPGETDEAEEMQAWEEWDNSTQFAKATEEIAQPKPIESKDTPEEEVDFFADMEPTVKVKKIYVKKKQTAAVTERANRFSINQDLDFKTSPELEEWVDEDNEVGWDEDDIDIEVDVSKVAKEARQLRKKERLQRSEEHKRSRISSHRSRNSKLVAKVS